MFAFSQVITCVDVTTAKHRRQPLGATKNSPMKDCIITGFKDFESRQDVNTLERRIAVIGDDNMVVSDGYHTFDELYDHRITLYIALTKMLEHMALVAKGFGHKAPHEVWRSKTHSDGSAWEGWFIMGINKEPGKQISYHLPLSRWEETGFAETLDKAPEFDGHTPTQVLERLKKL